MTYTARDAWHALRQHTHARIALGRSGVSQSTADHLAFQWDHASARDAVWTELDVPALIDALSGAGLSSMALQSLATDRATYLRRPDLGRQLSIDDGRRLRQQISGVTRPDVALVVADGLSARAVQEQAVPLLMGLAQRIDGQGWSAGPVCVVRQGRVAIGDGIGEAIGGRLCILLIGERPGLSSAASLGAYLTWNPRPGRTDAERNCVSNIHAGGLSLEAGLEAIWHLASESMRLQLTGVALKDERVLDTTVGLEDGRVVGELQNGAGHQGPLLT